MVETRDHILIRVQNFKSVLGEVANEGTTNMNIFKYNIQYLTFVVEYIFSLL